jgi:hypothetical protein
MWMIDPNLLCDKHLLGEHGEIHKHRHNFVKGHSVKGRLSPVVQIEPSSMKSRHDDLAKEMIKRGMNHKSPYDQPNLDSYEDYVINAKVDLSLSLEDLHQRCEACRGLSANS